MCGIKVETGNTPTLYERKTLTDETKEIRFNHSHEG